MTCLDFSIRSFLRHFFVFYSPFIRSCLARVVGRLVLVLVLVCFYAFFFRFVERRVSGAWGVGQVGRRVGARRRHCAACVRPRLRSRFLGVVLFCLNSFRFIPFFPICYLYFFNSLFSIFLFCPRVRRTGLFCSTLFRLVLFFPCSVQFFSVVQFSLFCATCYLPASRRARAVLFLSISTRASLAVARLPIPMPMLPVHPSTHTPFPIRCYFSPRHPVQAHPPGMGT